MVWCCSSVVVWVFLGFVLSGALLGTAGTDS